MSKNNNFSKKTNEWVNNVHLLEDYAWDVDDYDTLQLVHKFMSRLLKIRFFYNLYTGSPERIPIHKIEIKDSMIKLHTPVRVIDQDLYENPNMDFMDYHDYINNLYEQIGIEEYEFKIPGVTLDDLVCERSITIPDLYKNIETKLKEYKTYKND